MTNQFPKNTLIEQIFLDANVLLEIILGRENAALARRFLEKDGAQLNISALTAHLVVHFGKQIVELAVLRKFLADYNVLTLDTIDFEWAFNNIRNQDFEDALQLAVAIRNGCSKFITFDSNLTKAYADLVPIKTQLLN
jgi:predicted nucleic acid-binding protein